MEKSSLQMKQYEEAGKRIDALTKAFNLNPHIKDYFLKGKVYYSYITGGVIGSIDTIEYDARYAQVVKEFEERTHSLVYHVLETGDSLALLYVSANPANWSMERLQDNCIGAYVHNFAHPECSEDGDIVVDGYFDPDFMNYSCLVRVG